MEDAHIAELDLGDGNALFAVCDGHGGSEVAKFVRANFARELLNSDAYKEKDYRAALIDAFITMDRLMKVVEEAPPAEGHHLAPRKITEVNKPTEKIDVD